MKVQGAERVLSGCSRGAGAEMCRCGAEVMVQVKKCRCKDADVHRCRGASATVGAEVVQRCWCIGDCAAGAERRGSAEEILRRKMWWCRAGAGCSRGAE